MNKNVTLELGEVLKTGWDKAFSRFGLILGSIVVAQIVVGVPAFFQRFFNTLGLNINANSNQPGLAALFIVIGLLFLIPQIWLQVLTGIGLIRIQLNTVDAKPAEFGQLFKTEGVFWRYLGGAILYGLIVTAGFLLLIVPGIYWAIKYQFTLNTIVDKKVPVMDALHTSGQITYGHKWWLLGFGIILGLINLATIFTLFLGLIITVPVTVMAHMYVYRKLSVGGTSPATDKSAKPAVATVKS